MRYCTKVSLPRVGLFFCWCSRLRPGRSIEAVVVFRSSVNSAFLAFLILFLISGFGGQYLLWLTPWVAILALACSNGPFQLLSGAYCGVTYTCLCGGLPSYYACGFINDLKSSARLDVGRFGIGSRFIDAIGLVTWITICFCSGCFTGGRCYADRIGVNTPS